LFFYYPTCSLPQAWRESKASASQVLPGLRLFSLVATGEVLFRGVYGFPVLLPISPLCLQLLNDLLIERGQFHWTILLFFCSYRLLVKNPLSLFGLRL